MSEEDQIQAIANYCGVMPRVRAEGMVTLLEGVKKGDWIDNDPPEYTSDLNAMHEAEKVLDDGVLWGGYLNHLWDVVCPEYNQMGGLNAGVGLLLTHATASQRAEAFLRTIGKWKGS